MKDCIAIEASRLGIISQYTLAYCDAGDKRQGWVVSQYNPAKPARRPALCLRHGTGVGRRRTGAGACAGRADGRGARGRGRGRAAAGAASRRAGARELRCDTAGGLGHDTVRPAHDTAARARPCTAWAQVGRAGWVSWAKLVHCAPDSVLTQFLDSV